MKDANTLAVNMFFCMAHRLPYDIGSCFVDLQIQIAYFGKFDQSSDRRS